MQLSVGLSTRPSSLSPHGNGEQCPSCRPPGVVAADWMDGMEHDVEK